MLGLCFTRGCPSCRFTLTSQSRGLIVYVAQEMFVRVGDMLVSNSDNDSSCL